MQEVQFGRRNSLKTISISIRSKTQAYFKAWGICILREDPREMRKRNSLKAWRIYPHWKQCVSLPRPELINNFRWRHILYKESCVPCTCVETSTQRHCTSCLFDSACRNTKHIYTYNPRRHFLKFARNFLHTFRQIKKKHCQHFIVNTTTVFALTQRTSIYG